MKVGVPKEIKNNDSILQGRAVVSLMVTMKRWALKSYPPLKMFIVRPI